MQVNIQLYFLHKCTINLKEKEIIIKKFIVTKIKLNLHSRYHVTLNMPQLLRQTHLPLRQSRLGIVDILTPNRSC